MSNQNSAQVLSNETREAFNSVVKIKPHKEDTIKCMPISNNDLFANSENDDESKKSYLLKKFLQNSNEEYKTNELISRNTKPVPKPRKSKNNLREEIGSPSSDTNSTVGQKTYLVENVIKKNCIESVDIVVHNNPVSKSRSSRKNSSNLGKTSVKSINDISQSSKEINIPLTKLKETPDDHISRVDSNLSTEKSVKTKVIEDNKEVDTNSKYNYEKIVEIIIHKADSLQLDSYVTHPTVKVHIVNINTGKYYLKSDKSRSVVFYYENKEQDYILPVMTSSYNLQEKR